MRFATTSISFRNRSAPRIADRQADAERVLLAGLRKHTRPQHLDGHLSVVLQVPRKMKAAMPPSPSSRSSA